MFFVSYWRDYEDYGLEEFKTLPEALTFIQTKAQGLTMAPSELDKYFDLIDGKKCEIEVADTVKTVRIKTK